VKITPEQLEDYKNQLILTNSEIDLQEKELESWKAREEAELQLFKFIAGTSMSPGLFRKRMAAFEELHKAHVTAATHVKRLSIVKLRSQAAILNAMIGESEKLILEPTKGMIDLQ
jgi:hypothetical protein